MGERCAATAMVVATLFFCGACDGGDRKTGGVPDPSKAAAPEKTVAPKPVPVPVTKPKVILSHDLFDRRWRQNGLAGVAKNKCWDAAPEAPGSVTFFVVVAPDGSVSDVQPTGIVPRRGNEATVALHDCLAEMIRGMRFASGPGARSLVQVNRE